MPGFPNSPARTGAPSHLNLTSHDLLETPATTNTYSSSPYHEHNQHLPQHSSQHPAAPPPTPSTRNDRNDSHPHAASPSPPPTEFDNSTPYKFSAPPPSHLNTIYGRRTLPHTFDINPVPTNANMPMLMLMDNAQNSMIETLQRQLAEERERGAHRLQTETLMHQLISERNSNEARLQ
ncbi:hypothetical protein TeGR_g13904, partial [Tetraparma gracilis]